jgi:hypothetical protein
MCGDRQRSARPFWFEMIEKIDREADGATNGYKDEKRSPGVVFRKAINADVKRCNNTQ